MTPPWPSSSWWPWRRCSCRRRHRIRSGPEPPPGGRPGTALLASRRAFRSMGEDLGQEVAGPVGLRTGEELAGGGLLEEAALVHEHHPVGGVFGEAHLVG